MSLAMFQSYVVVNHSYDTNNLHRPSFVFFCVTYLRRRWGKEKFGTQRKSETRTT